jgi:uncharacterized membrane protein
MNTTPTPRTNIIERGFSNDSSQNIQYRLTMHARQLERELAALTEQRDTLAEKLAELVSACDGNYKELVDECCEALAAVKGGTQ